MPTENTSKGYIFDIQGLSVHDGPGCRTSIFLSGCTLNCFWCSNPEGISMKPVPMYFASKCISCLNCIKNCSQNAVLKKNGSLQIVRDYCLNCNTHQCISECYTDALKLSSYEISVTKLLQIIQRDRQFWGGQGGVTLSGGEPLLQISFAKEILMSCYESYIHTALETCGNIPYSNFQVVLPFTDWIFFDLKHLDQNAHLYGTGVKNSRILENARQLANDFEGRLIFRLPIIPEFNSSEENIRSVIAFMKEINKNEINILPLHHLGREKYHLLGKVYKGTENPVPEIIDLKKTENIFNENGIQCYIGSETPF